LRQLPRQLSGLTFAVASAYDRLEFLEENLLLVEAQFCCRSHHSISDRHQVDQNETAGFQFSYENLWLKGVCSHAKVAVSSPNIESMGICRSTISQAGTPSPDIDEKTRPRTVGVGGAFGFNGGLMLTGFRQFVPGRGFQLARDQLDFKAPEKHPTGAHFKNERIKPVDQQQFVIGRAASDADGLLGR
jgi:hypothetical protein